MFLNKYQQDVSKQKLEHDILFSYNNSISQSAENASIIVPNENMTKIRISSREDTSPIKCPENDKVIIQRLELQIKDLKSIIQNKRICLKKKK